MIRSRTVITIGSCIMLGCAPAATPEPETRSPAAGSASTAPVASVRCAPQDRMPLAGRASPYDSATVSVGGSQAKVCYGRPSARGRPVFGQLIPYGKIWRTGANEPTIIHVPFAARIAGIAVQPGSYSLYTVPGEREWTVVVNRATAQWGHESRYTPEIQAQEVGRATIPATRTDAPVETFVIRSMPAGGNTTDLVLEWENTRVRIPITRG